MKLIPMLCLVALMSGCAGRTQYGSCVGLIADKDPNLHYSVSVRNAFFSWLTFGTIITPVLWVTDYAYCPDGKKVSIK
jgi:hypothetical protein